MQTLEQLASGDTFIHRLHPLSKLLTTLVYIILVVSFDRNNFSGLIPYLLYPFLIMAISEIPYRPLLHRVALALPFCVMAGISNIILDRQIVLYLGGLAVSSGVLSFFTILLKTYLTVMSVLILISTTTLSRLSEQLIRLKVPPAMVMILGMTYRYIGILTDEAASMYTSYLLRSPRKKGIELRYIGSFMGRLLLRSIDRSERIYSAMKCRGWHGAESFKVCQKLFGYTDVLYCATVCGSGLIFRFINVTELIGKMFL